MKQLSLASHGRKISARLYQPEQPSGKAVLIVHGYFSNQAKQQSNAEVLCQLGFKCLTFDLSGRGDSEGSLSDLSINDIMQDVLTAYDCLATKDVSEIVVFGSSYGAYHGAVLTGQRKISGLLLRVPTIYPDELIKTPPQEYDKVALRKYRHNILPSDDNRALSALRNFASPVLVVESEHDDQVPHQVIAAYAGAAPQSDVIVMKGAQHSLEDTASQQAFLHILTDWARTL